MESYVCELCHNRIPTANQTIHSVRCRGVARGQATPAPTSAVISQPSARNRSHDATSVTESSKWTCLTCTYNNEIDTAVCEMCGTAAGEEHSPDFQDLPANPPSCNSAPTTSSSNSAVWNCTSCTYRNNANHSSCVMCQAARPAVAAFREQLLPTPAPMRAPREPLPAQYGPPSGPLYGYNDSSGGPSGSLATSMALGAGLGAGLAWFHDADVRQGAIAGAGIGAVGDILLQMTAEAEQRSRMRQMQLQQERTAAARQTEMRDFFQQRDAPFNTAGNFGNTGSSRGNSTRGRPVPVTASAYPVPTAQYGAYDQGGRSMSMDTDSSDSDDSGFGGEEGHPTGVPFPIAGGAVRARAAADPMELYMQQLLAASFMSPVQRRRMMELQQQGAAPGMARGQAALAQGMGGGLNIDRMPYQALLDMFPQPDRGVGEDTLNALPVRTYTAPPAPAAPVASTSTTTTSSSSSGAPSSGSRAPAAAPSSDSTSNSNNSCCICMEEYVQGDSVKTLPCLHCFHAQCVDHWLRQKQTCPVCKHSLTS